MGEELSGEWKSTCRDSVAEGKTQKTQGKRSPEYLEHRMWKECGGRCIWQDRPLNDARIRGTDPLCSRKSEYNFTLSSCIRGLNQLGIQPITDRSCSAVVCIYWKQSEHKWTHTVQTHIVQGSTLLFNMICLAILESRYYYQPYFQMRKLGPWACPKANQLVDGRAEDQTQICLAVEAPHCTVSQSKRK